MLNRKRVVAIVLLKHFAGHPSDFIRLNVTVPLCANCLMTSCPICSSNYTYKEGTVTKLLQELKRQTLKERREQAQLTMLYKITIT